MERHKVLNTTSVILERFSDPTPFAPGGHCRIYYQLLNTSSEEALVDADQMFIQRQSSNFQEVIQYVDVYNRCPYAYTFDMYIYGHIHDHQMTRARNETWTWARSDLGGCNIWVHICRVLAGSPSDSFLAPCQGFQLDMAAVFDLGHLARGRWQTFYKYVGMKTENIHKKVASIVIFMYVVYYVFTKPWFYPKMDGLL